jgi:hypothetical protein
VWVEGVPWMASLNYGPQILGTTACARDGVGPARSKEWMKFALYTQLRTPITVVQGMTDQ